MCLKFYDILKHIEFKICIKYSNIDNLQFTIHYV